MSCDCHMTAADIIAARATVYKELDLLSVHVGSNKTFRPQRSLL